MPFERQGLCIAAMAAAIAMAFPALAAEEPLGVWINDTGRGAIEIKPCGDKLCGHVVWVKDAADAEGCGRQIIGDVTPSGNGIWGDGWIYSPERKRNYNVELTPQADGTLKVKGFAGISFLSRTMIWTKAPADLVRCGDQQIEAAKPPPAAGNPDPAGTTPPPSAMAAPERREGGQVTKQAAPAPEQAPAPAPAPRAQEPPVAENEPLEDESDEIDVSGIAEEFGDVFTRKDGRCKVDTPWVKLDFDCGER